MTQSGLPELGRHIAEQEDALLAASTADEAVRRNIAQRVARPAAMRARPPFWFAAAAMAAAGIFGGTVFLLQRATSEVALSFTVGEPPRSGILGEWVSAPSATTLPVRFSDGTRVALAANARGRVMRVSPKGAEVLVEAGNANVSVVPKPAADWRVRTGPFMVRVTGTRFDVGWNPEEDRFHLELYEGKVIVSGCVFGDGQLITAGHRVTASCRAGSLAVTSLAGKDGSASGAESPKSSPPPNAPAPVTVAEVEGVPHTANIKASPVGSRSSNARAPIAETTDGTWQQLARAGRFERAYELATAAGFANECAQRSAADVLLLGDAARLTGHSDSARQAYTIVRRRFPASGEAARAAFDLGRLDLDAHNYRSAIGWLDTYLAEQPGGALASAALGRKLEAYVSLGQSDEARTIARAYLEHYSNGAHADYARHVLGVE